MSNSIQGSHEDVLKIVGRAVLTLHVHGESLSADKIASMIGCYAEDEPCDQEDRRLYALAMEIMSQDNLSKSA